MGRKNRWKEGENGRRKCRRLAGFIQQNEGIELAARDNATWEIIAGTPTNRRWDSASPVIWIYSNETIPRRGFSATLRFSKEKKSASSEEMIIAKSSRGRRGKARIKSLLQRWRVAFRSRATVYSPDRFWFGEQ